MTGKRRHPRHLIEGRGIYAKTIFDTEIEVLDISTGGCSFRGPKRFTIGAEYLFKFTLENRLISIKGSIVWEKLTGLKKIAEGESMPIYTAGVRFRDVFTDKAELVQKLIDLTIRELRDRRLSGVRLKIHPPEKALLGHLETCMVRDMSLGGARIETEEEHSAGMIFALELILGKNQEDRPIHCNGRVAFCHETPEKMPKLYSVGVEFMDMSEADRMEIIQFIQGLP
jgi:hypothetical protein